MGQIRSMTLERFGKVKIKEIFKLSEKGQVGGPGQDLIYSIIACIMLYV